MNMQPAIFLDRDGVINHDTGYIDSVERFEFIEGVFHSLRALRAMQYLLIVVTNQSGIERGLYSEETYHVVTNHMQQQLQQQGLAFDAIYYCPHDGRVASCTYRKPNPGMLLAAQARFNIDMSASWMVGDKITDIQAGQRAGVANTCLVCSGQPLSEDALSQADVVIDSLANLPFLLQTKKRSYLT